MLSLDAEEDSEELEPKEKPVENKPEAEKEEKATTDGDQVMTDERPATVMEADVTLQTAVEQKEAGEVVDAKSKDAVLCTETLPDVRNNYFSCSAKKDSSGMFFVCSFENTSMLPIFKFFFTLS